MPELNAGKYMITNTSTKQQATLAKANEGEEVRGALKNGANNQKASAVVLPMIPLFLCLDIPQWYVEKLDDGTYNIYNAGYDTAFYASASASKGQKIVAKLAKVAWKITELDPSTYRLAV
jgi:hypothetical protein